MIKPTLLLAALIILTGCTTLQRSPARDAGDLIRALDAHGCQIGRMRVSDQVVDLDCNERRW